MNVVFCTQIDYSFGEREHALSFARQIEKAGYRAHFLVAHQRIANHVQLAGFRPAVFSTPDALSRMIEEIDPVLVVGCELFNLASVLVQRIIASGRPVATMDGTTLGLEINNDPFRGPEFRRSLVLPDRYYALRPCPVNDVAEDTDRIFHWRLLPEISRLERDPACFQALGLDPSLRTVMLAIAPWALGGARYFGLDGYHDRLLNRIVEGLTHFGQRIQFVVVANVPPAPPVSAGPVSVHVTGLLRYDVYDHLLRTCDLIVSDNIIQNSVSKAVVMGIPHLIVQNMAGASSATSAGEGGLLAPELPYRCNIFPVKQIFPTWRQYSRIVDLAEYTDPADVRRKLCRILEAGHFDEGRRTARRAYVEGLSRLAEPGEILGRILGRPARPGDAGGQPGRA